MRRFQIYSFFFFIALLPIHGAIGDTLYFKKAVPVEYTINGALNFIHFNFVNMALNCLTKLKLKTLAHIFGQLIFIGLLLGVVYFLVWVMSN